MCVIALEIDELVSVIAEEGLSIKLIPCRYIRIHMLLHTGNRIPTITLPKLYSIQYPHNLSDTR